jgi:integrase
MYIGHLLDTKGEHTVARTIEDAKLQTREARGRLEARGKPHYRLIEPGLHLGYRKPRGRKGKPAAAGKWCLRSYLGKGSQSYVVETIGTADDFSDADGFAILNFAQAQQKARATMVKRVHEANGVAGPLTVKQVIDDYLDHLDDKGKSGYDNRKRAEAHILPVLGTAEVATLTTKQLHDWFVGLAKQPPRIRTAQGEAQQHRKRDESTDPAEWLRKRRVSANRTLTVLRAALNKAFRDGKVASDTAWRRVEPFEGVDTARVRYLTLAEAQRLLNASSGAFRKLAQAALQTGCRYGELIRLTVADFNPDAGTLHVRQSKSGKGRHVVLTAEGAEFFTDLTTGRSGSEIMLMKDNGKPWSADHQLRPMCAACERAKIDPPVGFHQLRHTWASHAVMNGVPLLVVAKNLGHVDTRMVEKHYGHLAPSYIADAIRAHAPKFGFARDRKVVKLTG